MKAVIQRVKNAFVSVDGEVKGAIAHGLLVYYSVESTDTFEMISPFLDKLVHLRIFEDESDKMNLSLDKISKEILFISQFTLAANLDRGNRPDFANAMAPQEALRFYQEAIKILKDWGYTVSCGVFGAHMQVSYINDGPVTFILDSKDLARFRKRN